MGNIKRNTIAIDQCTERDETVHNATEKQGSEQ